RRQRRLDGAGLVADGSDRRRRRRSGPDRRDRRRHRAGKLHLDPDRARDGPRPRARARRAGRRLVDADRLLGRRARDRREARGGVQRRRPEPPPRAPPRRPGARRRRRAALPRAVRGGGREGRVRARPAPAEPSPARAARGAVRRGRGRRPALPPSARREAGRVTALAIEIRRLSIGDLREIEDIERRAYRTPWSRSMFASELAKGTSICLGAFEGDQLVGYIVNSRYVDAWHVMNVAVDPDYQRRGIAPRLLERLFELTDEDDGR